MSKQVRFELNISGLRELMKSPAMHSVLEQAGGQVASRARSLSGEEWGTRVHDASYVAICNVYPDSDEARADNYENNTAVKALSSSGLPLTK